jgi:hypothetical protein
MDIIIGNVVNIQALPDACLRTRKCIDNHGTKGFEVVSFNPRSQRFGSTPAILVRAVAGPESHWKKWTGWLPLLEIGEQNDT